MGKHFFFLSFNIKNKVLILEKAWAKLFGNYEKIEAGLPSEALKALTGAPAEYLNTKVER